MMELIKEADITGTGCVYYVEGFTEVGECLFQHAFVTADHLSMGAAIQRAINLKGCVVLAQIDEWRAQALSIDTSAGKVVDSSAFTLQG